MAQPIRNSGWRPFTSRSNARGTSGTRPGNRCAISGGGVPAVSEARQTTTPQETQICLPFIQRHIELVNPDVLVTLGNPSTQTLLSTREGIMKTRGRWFDYDTGTRTIRAIATFHPAYLLRSPSYKRLTWQDLRAIAKALAQGAPASP